MEETGKLEGHDDDHRKDDHEQDHEAHGPAVPGAPHDMLQLLLRSPHAAVRHIHILVQVIQQAPLEVKLLVHCQCYALQDTSHRLTSHVCIC